MIKTSKTKGYKENNIYEASTSQKPQDEMLDNLWRTLMDLEGTSFHTAKGLEFTYRIKGGELFVSRKDKSITRATVELAYLRAMELGPEVTGPKKLGVFGASYLYPIFVHLGVIKNRNLEGYIQMKLDL